MIPASQNRRSLVVGCPLPGSATPAANHRRGCTRLKLLFVPLLAWVASPLSAADTTLPEAAAPALTWAAQPPEFQAEAPLTNSPTILYFTATWCGFCKQMERTTLTDEAVRTRLATIRHAKLDFDAQAEWVARFHVTGVPAFVAVNERGEEVDRVVGMMEPNPFLRWLDASKKRAAEIITAAEKAKAERAWLAEQVATGDPETKTAVREKLFDLLGRGDPASRDFARQVLTTQSERDPAVWVDGLERPDLAVRIATANLLRARLQHDFVFDPWAPLAERRVAVAHLREALAQRP